MPTIKTINDQEIEQLLHHISTQAPYAGKVHIPPRNYLLAILMLDAGLRVGEVIPLKHHQLYQNQEEAQTIHIEAATTKTKRDRVVPTTNRIRSAINDYYNHLEHLIDFNPHAFAFPSGRSQGHITCRTVRYIIKSASRTALSRSISPHTLRHTFATRLLRYTSTRIVQELLGHRSLSSTQIYTHPNSDDLKQAINQL